jgi:hypothetical protein
MDKKCPITDVMLKKGTLYGLAGWDADAGDDEDGSGSEDEDDEDDEDDDMVHCPQCYNPGDSSHFFLCFSLL